MNENLNLVEILKNCPKGIELYSPMYGLGILTKVTNRIHVKFPKEHNVKCFRPDGKVSEDGEIMLFPKDKTTWEGFQRPFVDGDIITYMFWRKPTTYIYRENGTHNTSYYVAYSSENNKLYDDGKGALAGNRHDLRFATEEEKQKLFKAIQENGYKWNAETKTLEKLKKEKFDPKTLQPFDKVLVRDIGCETRWHIQFFETMYDNKKYPFMCLGDKVYSFCIPYNDNTKHLIGKSEEAPEFYRYWEE